MPSGNSTDWIDRLQDIRDGDSIADTLQRILILPIVAFFVQAANAVEALFDVFIVPVRQFIGGIGAMIGSLFGLEGQVGISGIIDAGAAATAQEVSVFGIFSFPASVAIILLTGAIVAWYLTRKSSSDFIPWTFTDFPLIGTEEEE